jgi:hypothetical protein
VRHALLLASAAGFARAGSIVLAAPVRPPDFARFCLARILKQRSQMRALHRFALLSLLVLGLAASAARADVPRHDALSVTPIKKGGQTVGARVRMALITCNNGFVQDTAHVGLIDPAKTGSLTREGALKSENFKVLRPAEKGIQVGQPREVEFTLDYGPTWKSGDKLHVVSAWPSERGIHVFGAVTANHSRPPDLVLP